MLVWEKIAIYLFLRDQFFTKPALFWTCKRSCARCWRKKLCAVRMRNAIQGNYLKPDSLILLVTRRPELNRCTSCAKEILESWCWACWLRLAIWSTGGPSSRCEEFYLFLNLYANVQRVKRDILLAAVDIILPQTKWPERDSRLAENEGVMLHRFEFIKVCMGKNVNWHYSRNFDIFAIKMT